MGWNPMMQEGGEFQGSQNPANFLYTAIPGEMSAADQAVWNFNQ
jgi:hypothetical protein